MEYQRRPLDRISACPILRDERFLGAGHDHHSSGGLGRTNGVWYEVDREDGTPKRQVRCCSESGALAPTLPGKDDRDLANGSNVAARC